MKQFSGIVLVAVLSIGFSSFAMADEAAYKKLHAEAVAANDKALAAGGEWRDARGKKSKFIKCGDKKMSILHAAECYAAKGDYDNAIKYAEMAKGQGEQGYRQAMNQKNAGPRH